MFSFFQRALGAGADDYLHHRVRSVDVQRVKDLFLGKLPKSQFNWYIRRRMVLQWGGLSDGFDWFEKKFRKSLDLLRFFREIDYPISISTKGVWFADDPEYREVLHDAKNVHMKSSIIGMNWDVVKRVERGCPTSEERFQMLEKMNALGIAATTVRYRPFILGVSADYPFTHKSKQQIEALVKRTKEAGCYSLTSEFLCLERRASTNAAERYRMIGEVSGIPDLFEFYSKRSSGSGGLMRLNYDLKRPYFETMREACDKYDLRFFISDAHHKEKSYSAGCCGLPDTGPLSNINRGQFAEAILIAKRLGKVRWSDIAEAAEPLKEVMFFHAEGYNQGGTQERVQRMYQTMYDFMRDVWNNPSSMMSPARYFGGALVPGAPDEGGDIVYIYNEPFVLRGERINSVDELEFKQHAQRMEATRDEGGEWGHVAYPVRINGVDATDNELQTILLALSKVRLNAHWYLSSGQQAATMDWGLDTTWVDHDVSGVDEMIHMEATLLGEEHIWVLHPRLFLYSQAQGGVGLNLRTVMSRAEGEMVNGQQLTPLPMGLAMLRAAEYTPEQRGML